MGSTIAWSSETLELSQLKPAKYNPRKASKKQLADISDSIEKFNIAEPLVINQDMTLIGGHQRLKVLQQKGVKVVAVRVPSRQLTIDEEKELNLRLNKNTGEFDFDILGAGEFSKDMLAGAGFSGDELERIFDVDIHEDGFDAQKEYDKINKPQAKPGEARRSIPIGKTQNHVR